MSETKRSRRGQRFIAVVLVAAILAGAILAGKPWGSGKDASYKGSAAYAYLEDSMQSLSHGWLQWMLYKLGTRLSSQETASGCFRRVCVDVGDGDFAAAAQWMRTLLEMPLERLDTEKADLYMQLACIHSLDEDPESAVKAAQRAVELNPEDFQILQLCYQFSMEAGDSASAAEALKNYAALAEDETRYEEIADLYLDAGNYTESGRFYGKAIQIQGGNHRLYYMRGTCWMLLGRYEDAISDFANSQMPGSLYSRGICEMALNDFAQAKNCFEESMKRGEQTNDARMMLAVCLLEMEDYEQAEQLFDEYLRAGGSYGEIAYYRGTARAMQKNYQAAIEDYEAAIQAGYFLQESLFAAAQCRYYAGAYEEAIKQFESCIEQGIQVSESWYYLGLSLAAIGEAGRAEQALNQALSGNAVQK